jgi:hypothetical protein
MNSETYNQDHHEAPNQHEVTVLELIGGHTPHIGLDQEDVRPVPEDTELESLASGIMELLETFTTGTKMEDDILDIGSGICTSLHFLLSRIEKRQYDTQMEIRRLDREFDGSEIKDHQLQQQTNLLSQTDERAGAIEALRDALADHMTVQHGHRWHPPQGSHYNKRKPLTAAVMTARDVLKAQKERDLKALIPVGSLVAFAGPIDFEKVDPIWKVLDQVRQRHPDMVLVHGGSKKGAELIAAKWAENRKVDQVRCEPEWKRYNKAAPFRRNDEMLKLDLIGLIAIPGSGVTENLMDKARQKKVPVKQIAN